MVPLPSDLCTTVIACFGRLIPGLREAIAGSSQLVMLPRKILASTSPVNFRPFFIPGRLYAGTTALIDSGIVTTVAGSAEYRADVNRASVAPMSTVLAVI